MTPLPPPTTFAEGLRLLYSRYIVAAGIAVGVGVLGLIAMLFFGEWPKEHYGRIIDYLGWLALGGGGFMVVVIAFLGLGGPARSLKAAWGKLSIETEGDA